jgi:hypothetical protein
MADQKQQNRYVLRFTFSDNPEQGYTIDVANLTRRVQVALEDHFAMPIDQVEREGWLFGSARGAVFLGYLARKREEPEFTLEQAYEFDADADAGEEKGADQEADEETGRSAGKSGGKKKTTRPTKPRTRKRSGSRSSGSTSE